MCGCTRVRVYVCTRPQLLRSINVLPYILLRACTRARVFASLSGLSCIVEREAALTFIGALAVTDFW